MVDHVKLAATAKRLVEANGRTVTLYEASSADAVAGQPYGPALVTPVDADAVKACFVPVAGSGLGYTLRDRATSLSKVIVQECLVATTSLNAEDLRNADSISDGTRAWKIVVREELAPGDTSMLWAFGLAS